MGRVGSAPLVACPTPSLSFAGRLRLLVLGLVESAGVEMIRMGRIEQAGRERVKAGDQRLIPSQSKPFTVDTIDAAGGVLLLGTKRARTAIRWSVLGGVGTILARGWMTIGGAYNTPATSGTLDAYLKHFINRPTAGWVAVPLETAGMVEIDRTPPARARLREMI